MKARRIVEINVNGILAWPGRSDGWTDRAVTIGHTLFSYRSEKFEYMSGIFSRHFYQEDWASRLADLCDRYLAAGFAVFLRGHSNGCDIICRALPLIGAGYISGVQLIAAACPSSFDQNGLNAALKYGYVGRVQLCCSSNDHALWAAQITYPLLNLVGNGYGCLGFSGPTAVCDSIEHRVDTFWDPDCGHSDWVSTDNLLSTMQRLHPLIP